MEAACEAISSKVNWKEGFVRDRARYKRHERFMQMIREEAEAIFSERVLGLCLDQIHQFDAVNDQPRSLAIPTETEPSMVADPLDRISVPTPCLILIHVGKHGRVEVMGNALAFPSDMFYGTPIPPGYIWVQVVLIDPKHGEEPLDIPAPEPEPIHLLGHALDRFILWSKIEIRVTPLLQ